MEVLALVCVLLGISFVLVTPYVIISNAIKAHRKERDRPKHCQICEVTLKSFRHDVVVDGRRLVACSPCNRRIREIRSREAVRRLVTGDDNDPPRESDPNTETPKAPPGQRPRGTRSATEPRPALGVVGRLALLVVVIGTLLIILLISLNLQGMSP